MKWKLGPPGVARLRARELLNSTVVSYDDVQCEPEPRTRERTDELNIEQLADLKRSMEDTTQYRQTVPVLQCKLY